MGKRASIDHEIHGPSLVYEEGSLIKRTIRDLYTKEISEVLVSGEQAFEEARDFMNLILPSHAKNVKLYKDSQNLFPVSMWNHNWILCSPPR